MSVVSRDLPTREAWLVVAALGAVVVVNLPGLGNAEWAFHPGPIHAVGVLAPLVRAAHGRWDVGLLRSAAMLGGVVVAGLAGLVLAFGRLRLWLAATGAVVVVALLLLPAVFLQAGLRQSSAPWFFTNDSTYQIEIAGSLIRSGENPYGYDYRSTGLPRFYSLRGTAPPPSGQRQVALRHFAYFPGSAAADAIWGVLPSPLSDYRFFLALCALALLPATFLFRVPFGARLAIGALFVANPLVVQAVWFGTTDVASLIFIVLAFGFASRGRFATAAALLACAVLFKQFAIVAIPFAALLIALHRPRERLLLPLATFAVVAMAGIGPFLVADPGAFWSDTITYGTGTYPIIGYGLAGLLLRAHILASRSGSYPFVPLAVAVWAPISGGLLWYQRRIRTQWSGAVGFAISVFVLLFIARVFQTSYLVWPLFGGLIATLLASEVGVESEFVA